MTQTSKRALRKLAQAALFSAAQVAAADTGTGLEGYSDRPVEVQADDC